MASQNGSKSWFTRFARWAAHASGQPYACGGAATVVIVWAAVGPLAGFSNTWQLVINTGTSVVTFLMVFLIQNTQNRDTEALHVKIDELLRTARGADNKLMDLEELDDKEIDEIRARYEKLALQARARRDKLASRRSNPL